ncbi:MAG: dityrosine synthesis enzyme [Candelina submexicana]|nr:MAG: dityrosine synthesis enzyme [Candelina submexicana]
MDFTNKGDSIYHEIQAVYARSVDGDLLHIAKDVNQRTGNAWPQIWEDLHAHLVDSCSPLLRDTGSVTSTWEPSISIPWVEEWVDPWASYENNPQSNSTSGYAWDAPSLTIKEYRRPGEKQVIGIIFLTPCQSSGVIDAKFRDWFTSLIISETWLGLAEIPRKSDGDGDRRYCRAITDIFEEKLRNISTDDQWHNGGREYFEDRIHFHTARMVRIEACLPAFPCKSSNPDKVAGPEPDQSEELALRRMAEFAEDVGKVYPPGIKVSIISDGQVFSDCIGVDDHTVDTYSKALMHTREKVLGPETEQTSIGFYSLRDLFFNNPTIRDSFEPKTVAHVEVPHFISTRLTDAAELSRKILIAGCQINPEALRAKIDGRDQSILALYKGFSKFMLEDLAKHPSTTGLTKKQCKKLSSKIAFEMISRNQAYSNLVELLFPLHLRLSIHAHRNNGPKFGIQLLSHETCKTVKSLEGGIPETSDLLHIPTPWHNCVFRFEGDHISYVTKAKVILDALRSKKWKGRWVEANSEHGGHFVFEPSKQMKQRRPSRHEAVHVRPKPRRFSSKQGDEVRPCLQRRRSKPVDDIDLTHHRSSSTPWINERPNVLRRTSTYDAKPKKPTTVPKADFNSPSMRQKLMNMSREEIMRAFTEFITWRY